MSIDSIELQDVPAAHQFTSLTSKIASHITATWKGKDPIPGATRAPFEERQDRAAVLASKSSASAIAFVQYLPWPFEAFSTHVPFVLLRL
jgi:hypothetical protein